LINQDGPSPAQSQLSYRSTQAPAAVLSKYRTILANQGFVVSNTPSPDTIQTQSNKYPQILITAVPSENNGSQVTIDFVHQLQE
jgi:hypothetical protein